MKFYNMKELSEENKVGLLRRGRKEIESAEEAVKPILEEVREQGDRAVIKYTKKFDRVEVESLSVSREEIEGSLNQIDPHLVEALKRARDNIAEFHHRQMPEEFSTRKGGRELGMVVRPIPRVGCYVPGGRASYPTTVLMCAVPARVAGVKEVAVATPPQRDGKVNPLTLAACSIAGVDRVYRVGGAQAIGALAYGTGSVGRVDKIVGPGNIYVTASKAAVSREVSIDMPAGPSEVLIIADQSATPETLAYDLLAQAEHDPQATCILATPSPGLAEGVHERLKETGNGVAQRALDRNGAIIVVRNLEEAVSFCNDFAPEHLQIITNMDDEIIKGVNSAGSIFLGSFTPVASGDYASGTNHVLPTSGYARAFSGLNATSFLKLIPWQKLSWEALRDLKDIIVPLAEAEGLKAHAESVRIRLKEE